MNMQKKLLNDFLFAPARYLDQNGTPVDANFFQRVISAPQIKTAAVATASVAFAFAAARAPEVMQYTLRFGAMFTAITAISDNIGGGRGSPPYYYFDTNPEKKLPIPNTTILTDLVTKRDSLKNNLKNTVFIGGAAFGIIGTLGFSTLNDPLYVVQTAGFTAGLIMVVNGTRKVATAWRAAQVLDGDWNVLTHKPDPAREHVPANAAPAPSHG